MSTPTKFRVAICGGGIGGLSLALALAPYEDIAIDIYEAAAKFREIGAGIGIWGRGIAALRKLGLEERIRAISTAAPGEHEGIKFDLRRSDQPSGGELFGYLEMTTNLGLHRSQFIDLLAEILSDTNRATTYFGKRCVSFTQRSEDGDSTASTEEPVTVYFADGTSARCDVLVGCDGIKSAVRGELIHGASALSPMANGHTPVAQNHLRRFAGTRFSGTVLYRALINPEDLRKLDLTHSAITGRKMYLGKDKHVVSYPVAGGRFLNFAAFSSDPTRQGEWEKLPWVVEAEHAELLELFKGFEPEVEVLLKCVGKTSRWAIYDLEPLPFWSRGNVTLLGDAAHATTPFLGAGGGQVLEDAYVLSQLLGSTTATRETLPSVLSAYERVRLPRANRVTFSSREARRAFERIGEYESSSNEQVAEAVARLSEWLWEGNGELDDDVREAERWIIESLKR